MTPLQRWINGVFGGFIGGGAAAITSGPIVSMFAPDKFNTGSGLHALLGLMSTMFVTNGLVGAALYLKMHPTPWDGFTDRRSINGDTQANSAGAGK